MYQTLQFRTGMDSDFQQYRVSVKVEEGGVHTEVTGYNPYTWEWEVVEGSEVTVTLPH